MNISLWTFVGYVTENGRRIVQEWYDDLPIEEYEELQDQLNYLSITDPWKRPQFDKVATPLHEVRAKANAVNHHIRVYGVFYGPRHQFLLLHGVTAKKKGHDKKGQELAAERLRLLKQGKGAIHEFVIESRTS